MAADLTFACALANPSVRTVIRSHIEEMTLKSKLADDISKFLLDDEKIQGTVQPIQIKSHFAGKITDEEIDNIVARCDEMIGLGDNISSILKDFGEFYASRMLTDALEQGQSDKKRLSAHEIVARIQEIRPVIADLTPLDVLGDLDVDQVMQLESGGASALPSSFDLIRRATPYQGYLRGQVIQWVAPPGVGKSLGFANEAIAMCQAGAQGYFIALGDMMRLDFIIRFTSIMTGVDYYDVTINPKKYFSDEVKKTLRNLRITVVPAGHMDPSGLADFIENRVQPEQSLDFVMVDYDSNFAKTSDSMYTEGDAVYNTLSRIARPLHCPYRAVFVASQPKIAFWGEEELPMECAAESSRKQAIIDLQITMGRSPRIHQCKAGVLKIGKARRGKVNEKSFYRVKDNGKIEEITGEEYSMLRQYTSERN